MSQKPLVTFTCDHAVYEAIKEEAATENRSVSNFIQTILLAELTRRGRTFDVVVETNGASVE